MSARALNMSSCLFQCICHHVRLSLSVHPFYLNVSFLMVSLMRPPTPTLIRPQVPTDVGEVADTYARASCHSPQHYTAFAVTLLVYQGLLLVGTLVACWHVRKVRAYGTGESASLCRIITCWFLLVASWLWILIGLPRPILVETETSIFPSRLHNNE